MSGSNNKRKRDNNGFVFEGPTRETIELWKRLRYGDNNQEDDDGGDDDTQSLRSKYLDNNGLFTSTQWTNEADQLKCYYHESPEALLARNNIDEFTIVDAGDIKKYWGCTNSQPHLHNITNILLNQIMGGDIRFMSDSTEISDELTKQLSSIWSPFLEQFERSLWEVGWVAVGWVKDKNVIGVPVVIDPNKFIVRYHQSGTSRISWLYQIKADNNGNSSEAVINQITGGQMSDGAKQFLPNVMTFVDGRFTPKDGRIRSRSQLAMKGFEWYEERKNLLLMQEARAVARMMYIETKEVSRDDLRGGEELYHEMLKRTVNHHNYLNVQLAKDLNAHGLDKDALSKVGQQPQRDEMSELLPRPSPLSKQIDDYKHVAAGLTPKKIDLRPGTHVVFEPAPYIPADLDKLEQECIKYAAQQFGVHEGFVTITSSHEWIQALREQYTQDITKPKKQLVQSQMESIWHVIYDKPMMAMYVANRTPEDLKQSDPMKAAKLSTSITILLPSLPVKAFMMELYEKGILTLEGLREYLHANHSIPMKYLNKTPKPPPLVYEPPPEPSEEKATPTKKNKQAPKKSKKSSVKTVAKERPNGDDVKSSMLELLQELTNTDDN